MVPDNGSKGSCTHMQDGEYTIVPDEQNPFDGHCSLCGDTGFPLWEAPNEDEPIVLPTFLEEAIRVALSETTDPILREFASVLQTRHEAARSTEVKRLHEEVTRLTLKAERLGASEEVIPVWRRIGVIEQRLVTVLEPSMERLEAMIGAIRASLRAGDPVLALRLREKYRPEERAIDEMVRLREGRKTHTLKCHPGAFASLRYGLKTFEVRHNDRGFEVGDHLELHEWDPQTKKQAGNCSAWSRT